MSDTGAHALPAGLRLGPYEIIAPLSSGGMAAVYLGRRSGTDAHVAIKVVHPRFAGDPQFALMFLDEARLSARIQHPNVVRVEATGNEGELYYLVMEYLQGASLQRFVRKLAESKRVLVHEVVVSLIAGVAAGLHGAHDTTDEHGHPLGIVHRDVTPQNILVSYGGGVKLIDFGIAKAAGRSHQTAKGMLKGKLRYMAPEQAAGRPVDRRTDVYALGIVLWEMLTYRKAFSARTDAELVRLVLQPKVVPPSRLAPSVSPALDAVVMQAIAPAPDERFQTALAFRNALLSAVPEAARVDETEIARLLRTVLADEIAQDAAALPPGAVTASVVVSQPQVVGEREEALTQIAPASFELDGRDSDPPPPRPGRPAGARSAPTAYGIGSALPMAPATPVAIAPSPSPSLTPPMPAAPMAAPLGPTTPSRGAPMLAGAMPRMHTAPAASFTPPNAVQRPVLPAAPPRAVPAATPAGRGATFYVAIVIAVVVTIALGVGLGWIALHQASRMMP